MAVKQPGKEEPSLHGEGQPVLEDHSRPVAGMSTPPAIEHLQKELRQAQQALADLHRNEQFLAGLVESAMDAIVSVDENLRIVLFNPAAERMFGLPAAAALGQTLDMLLPEDVRLKHAEHIHLFGQTGASCRHPMGPGWVRARRANGEIFPVEASISQISVAGHQMFTSILRDISQRMLDELVLREREERLALFAATTFEGVAISEHGRLLDCNEQFARMMGYTVDELVGRLIEERVTPEDRERVVENIRLGRESIVEHGMLRKDGRRILVEAHGKTIPDGAPDGRRYTAVRDITERKRIEQALRNSQADLNRAQSVGQIGSWRLDSRRNELRWSDETYRIHGIPKGLPLTYEVFLTTVHPDDRAYVDRMWKACLQGEPYDIEHRLVVDGKVKWVREKAELEFDEHGQLLGGFGITQDITDIKLAEQALRESEARFQLATEIGRSGTWDWDLSSGEIIWSRGHYEILGYRVGEVMPSFQAWTDRVHPEDRPGIEAVLQRTMAGHQGHAGHQDYVIEFRVVWPDGSVHWMSAHGRYEYTENGTCRRMIGVTADVTSLKQAELALLEADRRKDEFLAMLAHELRNPLAPIRNAAHVLGRLETQEPQVQWVRKTIERQVGHLTRLVDDLLDVSRIVRGKVTLRLEPVELAAVVNQALDMARPLIDARGHRIAVSLPGHVVKLEGDPVRLAQVLLNLLDNAAKYTPEGGRITLNASAFGQVIEIRVSDNGVGIPAELLPRIFDLFQQGERTLDRSQGGLGIGLTLVKRLVEMHGGQLDAHSAGVGLGSTFTIRLPVLSGASATPGHHVQSPAAAYCRVLVVDDDPAVADSMVVLLRVVGHDVMAAASGEAALELARSFRPQVVLLDIGLQGMDGYEVARRLRNEQAAGENLCLMAVTGYGDAEAHARCEAAGFDRHLIKPVQPDALCELLADIGRAHKIQEAKR
jgi:PAS domain S-box-containing protein